MKKLMLVLAFAGLGLVANAQTDAKMAPAKPAADAPAKPAHKAKAHQVKKDGDAKPAAKAADAKPAAKPAAPAAAPATK